MVWNGVNVVNDYSTNTDILLVRMGSHMSCEIRLSVMRKSFCALGAFNSVLLASYLSCHVLRDVNI